MLQALYERHCLPSLLDCACGLGAIHKERAAIVPRAKGEVLEIGIGSGLNLSHYQAEQISRLCGLDPSPELSAKARSRAKASGLQVELLELGAESIPAADHSFDSLVCTFTLCTIPEPMPALAEMRRVLKPDGQLLFCEHGVAPSPSLARWQGRINRIWSPLAGGCRLDRDSPALLTAAGFRILELEQHHIPGPKPWTYISRGVAVPAD
ncbi:MAG: class I SAM-dependent methyltransferase [Oceanococcaceae bacterium]